MEKHRKNAVIISTLGVMMILFGVTYSFFNYTRTGVSNTIKVGRIYFNSEQTNTITLVDVFPIDKTLVNSSSDVGTVTINVEGDTTYDDGVEYQLSVSNLTNTVGNKEIPIDVVLSTSGIGDSDPDYFDNRGGNSPIYKVLSTGTISNNQQLLVGYIPKGSTGVDGTVTIKAYLDKDKIAISDTYPEGDVTHTEGEEPNQTTVTDYTNGTTDEWVDNRLVLTTTEWNNIHANGVSFQVKVEANEGTWVEEPAKKIESCPGCKFMYLANTPMYTPGNTYNATPTILTSGLYDNYEELIGTTNKNYFIGVKLNNNNEVTNVYACGVKDNVPFCIEGILYGAPETATAYATNKGLLQGTELYNNTCTVHIEEEGTANEYEFLECGPFDNSGFLSAGAHSYGLVMTGVGNSGHCDVYNDGRFVCFESASGGGG